jgi:hypothetical protein
MSKKQARTIEQMLADRAQKPHDDPSLPLRQVKSLSPSALLCFEKTPVEFFFRYIFPDRQVFHQTRPMAYGSAFDMRVKEILARRHPKKFDPSQYGLLKAVDKAYHGDLELKMTADLLAVAYCAGPPGRHLREHPPVLMEGNPAVVDIGGVPVYGRVDVETAEPRILDFKVSGANSSAYPVVGYVDGWTFDRKTKKWQNTGGHSKGFKSLTLTKPDWAMQLTTYDMLRTGGAALNRRSPIGVDQVSFHPKGLIHFTHLREEIPCAFKKEVVARYKRAWEAVQSGEVIPPELRGMPVAQLDLLRGQIRKF